MAAVTDIKSLLTALQFSLEEGVSGSWIKTYPQHNNYVVRVSIDNEEIFYGDKIQLGGRTTCNFKDAENFVVLECVNRLLEKGYQPQDITLEKTFPSGHGHSGRLDIFIEKEGKAFLMIECKTFGREFDKELSNIYKNGGQLFTYFQNDRSAEILMLYASELDKHGKIQYSNEIVRIEEDYTQTTNVKDFYDRWNKLTKNNGVFDKWVAPYGFQSKALTPKGLKEITQADSGFIFNQFLEILRHNVVSDKPNAFNKIFTLFLCKIYDEKITRPDEELAFQWFYTPYQYEGLSYPPDDHISFQKRLTDLYKKGMREFLDKEVTDISDAEFDKKYELLDAKVKAQLKDEFTEIRLKKNNEFAIKEVFNDDSFYENAKVVKEVVELLQGYKIRYTKKHQYLSDFFELLLTTGLKQESGQFFTPVPIAQFIIKSLPLDKLIAKKLEEGKAENLLPTIIDYAAGSGHFITESMHEVQRIIDKTDPEVFIDGTARKIKTWQQDHFEWALKYVYGIEKDYRLVKVGKVGCYLHGDGLAQIIHSDGLGGFAKTEEYKELLKKTDKDFPKENKQFDIVVSNPPYSVSAFRNSARRYYTENDFDIYGRLTDQSSEIECLFIERTKQLLKDGGIAGIILPSSILSNTGIYTKAREIILSYFEIIAIAELGSNTFMATGTNTVTLFLRRRNNYEHLNIKASVERFTTNLQDVTINGIEKPIAKYVAHVWEGLIYTDYLTLLQKQPNDAITTHELYQDYCKKISGKNEQEKWNAIIALEQEKLLYFILAYPQQVVLVKTGDKNEEKAFLGYEFSYRRGSEGIHPMQRGKSIDQCTRLFDPETFENPEKASTYIYHAFEGKHYTPIAESLQENITRHRLVDMLTFDRVEFEKGISLAVKKKFDVTASFGTRYNLRKLGELADFKRGPFGGSLKKEIFVEKGYKVYEQKHAINNDFTIGKYYITEDKFKEMEGFSLNEGDIIMSCSGTIGKIAIFPKNAEKGIINQALLRFRPKKETLTSFFKLLLESITNSFMENSHGAGLQNVASVEILKEIKIPLPPIDIQEKIVAEIEALEEKEKKGKDILLNLNESTRSIIESQFSISQFSEIGKIAEIKGGKRIPKGLSFSSQKTDYPYIRVSDFTNGSISIDTLKYIDKSVFDKIDNYTISSEDIYISIAGTIGLVGIIPKELDGKSLTENAAKIVIRDTSAINQRFMYLMMTSNKVQIQIQERTRAVGVPKLALKRIETIKIPLPSIFVQQQIVSQISVIEAQIAALEKELETIPQQKEAILKKYL